VTELLGIDFSQFHFLRPAALWAMVPTAVLIGLLQWRKNSAGNWQQVINPALLPYLLQGKNPSRLGLIWLFLAWITACIALAGPTWQQLPQPVHKQDSALILIMDLSPSMLAEDIKPSRLARARFKLIDILKKRREGYSALVVYGGDAFALSPLTEDSNTIISLVPVLQPALLPEYGSNIEAAIEMALELAVNGGYQQGDLLLITDEVARPAFAQIQSLLGKRSGFRLSVLGVGTAQGAPIPTGAGGFAKDYNGAILIPKLNAEELQMLAQSAGGSYATLSPDDSDIDTLLATTEQRFPDPGRELERSFDLWDDQGFWLILLLLPIILATFRKGTLAVIVLAPLLLPQPADAFEWQDLWRTPDQQASAALAGGDNAKAQSLFDDPQWRGSAAYKAGDYTAALDDFIQSDSADSHYNRGNALAKSGDLQGALDAYDEALKRQPDMDDAQANRDLVEQLKQQQDQQQKSDQNQESEQNQDSQNQSQNQQQSSDGSDSQSQSQPADNSPGQEQPSEQAKSEQDQTEQDQVEKGQAGKDPAAQEEKQQSDTSDNAEQPTEGEATSEQSDAEKQAQQELEQWLRRVPDDPGGLLREKFRYQSRQRAMDPRRPAPPSDQQQRW
jgi:Ca-activated chloride channel homolog